MQDNEHEKENEEPSVSPWLPSKT